MGKQCLRRTGRWNHDVENFTGSGEFRCGTSPGHSRRFRSYTLNSGRRNSVVVGIERLRSTGPLGNRLLANSGCHHWFLRAENNKSKARSSVSELCKPCTTRRNCGRAPAPKPKDPPQSGQIISVNAPVAGRIVRPCQGQTNFYPFSVGWHPRLFVFLSLRGKNSVKKRNQAKAAASSMILRSGVEGRKPTVWNNLSMTGLRRRMSSKPGA